MLVSAHSQLTEAQASPHRPRPLSKSRGPSPLRNTHQQEPIPPDRPSAPQTLSRSSSSPPFPTSANSSLFHSHSTPLVFEESKDPEFAEEELAVAHPFAVADSVPFNISAVMPMQLSDEKRADCERGGFDSAEIEFDQNYHRNQIQSGNQSQHLSLSKSACSSTSETSKGSRLSLSRSEIRVNRSKAMERVRERATKDDDREEAAVLENGGRCPACGQGCDQTEMAAAEGNKAEARPYIAELLRLQKQARTEGLGLHSKFPGAGEASKEIYLPLLSGMLAT